jgi:hypothetical protein
MVMVVALAVLAKTIAAPMAQLVDPVLYFLNTKEDYDYSKLLHY